MPMAALLTLEQNMTESTATDFTMTKDGEGIATITWDCPGKSMNVLNMEALLHLDTLVDDALGDEAVKGIIITSGKRFRWWNGP